MCHIMVPLLTLEKTDACFLSPSILTSLEWEKTQMVDGLQAPSWF